MSAVAAKAEMLIRRPVAEVYEAFIDPQITTKVWFTKSTGRLDEHAHVRWDWEMYDASAEVDVVELAVNERIVLEWDGYGTTTIEWTFTARDDGTTFVSIENRGFIGAPDEVAEMAVSSTEGFAFLLAGMKALLEHGVVLGLVPDRFPDGVEAAHS
jgi:uncharacterized protein YndB with AHSA1/START domain